jgi:hypothetical protein
MSTERRIRATFFKDEMRGSPLRVITYSRIDTALPRLTWHLMMNPQHGEYVVLNHVWTEKELGHAIRRGNKITSKWVWD